jgi:radical SAM superfamily enzyme YgiQ (UPF0313 family)
MSVRMGRTRRLKVVLIKPSKYAPTGHVERFRRGFMPNASLAHLASLTPREHRGCSIEVQGIDEYVHVDLDYLRNLHAGSDERVLFAAVGVQSHQFHRALDLAAIARTREGALAVIGGPHPMTCDTSAIQGSGVSVSQAEAELTWSEILTDAICEGELKPIYGQDRRWAPRLDPPVMRPYSRSALRRYAIPVMGVYPSRGCPYKCDFCSVIKIAGNQIRSQPVHTTIDTLRAMKRAGVRLIMFVSDNFNKDPQADELLEAMIDARLDMPFFVQCDTQVIKRPAFVERLARAGCFQMFVGIESLDRDVLRDAGKHHNHPQQYGELIRLCRQSGITTHFSMILGFPYDTRVGIEHQLVDLQMLRPDVASFWLLTPIPGTVQYRDFLNQGLLHETNLDRYDATCPTWRHPHLGADELRELLIHCHRRFYRTADVVTKTVRSLARARDFRWRSIAWAVPGFSMICRLGTYRRPYPTVGGLGVRCVDHVESHLPLRRRFYGFELAPLPQNLELSEYDRQLNARAKLPVVRDRGQEPIVGEPW